MAKLRRPQEYQSCHGTYYKKFPDSVGLPLPGGKIKIKKSKADTDGEIVYKGKNVFLGYSNSYRDLKNKDKIKGILNTGILVF